MTLDEGKDLALAGAPFGAVHEALYSDADREQFRAWWVFDKRVPALAARGPRPAANGRAPKPVPTGDVCRCGGLLVRTGTCLTCSGCGESSGGCS